MAIRAGHVERVKGGRRIPDGQAREVVQDHLEELARAGARRILTEALEEEVENYLGRGPYERSEKFRGYRNGGTRRRLTLGAGTIELDVPRVRDVPAGEAGLAVPGMFWARCSTGAISRELNAGPALEHHKPGIHLRRGHERHIMHAFDFRLRE